MGESNEQYTYLFSNKQQLTTFQIYLAGLSFCPLNALHNLAVLYKLEETNNVLELPHIR